MLSSRWKPDTSVTRGSVSWHELHQELQSSYQEIKAERILGATNMRSGDTDGFCLEVFAIALRLGLISFGGPIAHLGYFREDYVVRRNQGCLRLVDLYRLPACEAAGGGNLSAPDSFLTTLQASEYSCYAKAGFTR